MTITYADFKTEIGDRFNVKPDEVDKLISEFRFDGIIEAYLKQDGFLVNEDGSLSEDAISMLWTTIQGFEDFESPIQDLTWAGFVSRMKETEYFSNEDDIADAVCFCDAADADPWQTPEDDESWGSWGLDETAIADLESIFMERDTKDLRVALWALGSQAEDDPIPGVSLEYANFPIGTLHQTWAGNLLEDEEGVIRFIDGRKLPGGGSAGIFDHEVKAILDHATEKEFEALLNHMGIGQEIFQRGSGFPILKWDDGNKDELDKIMGVEDSPDDDADEWKIPEDDCAACCICV